MKEKIQKALKALAVGGAFMVPVAGLPLAILVAKKLYGKNFDFDKVREIMSNLISMGKVKQEQITFKDWLLIIESAERC